MNDFSIRITRRVELGDRSHEEAIDIDFGKPPQTLGQLVHGSLEVAKAPDHDTMLAGEPADMAEALATLSRELGCANTLDDMLHAIDALSPRRLEWSPTLCDGERVNFADAEKACAALGEGWRLPTRMELESILDLTRHDPAVDTTRFPDTKSGWYWTSTPCAWSSDCAWFVGFYGGGANYCHRDYDGAFVRAVRSVPAGGGEDYEAKYATAERLAKPAATEPCDFCGVNAGELHAYDCTALDATPAPPPPVDGMVMVPRAFVEKVKAASRATHIVAQETLIDEAAAMLAAAPATPAPPPPVDGGGDPNEVVGHKTLRDETGRLYHEPLTRAEADQLLRNIEEQEARRNGLMPDERAAIAMFFDAWLRLKDFGWREAIYCPKDGTLFSAIEPGCTAILDCSYEGEWPKGFWWSYADGDSSPSHPALFKPKEN